MDQRKEIADIKENINTTITNSDNQIQEIAGIRKELEQNIITINTNSDNQRKEIADIKENIITTITNSDNQIQEISLG